MSDTQLSLAIGLPIVTILTSLVISLVQISGIREYMRALRADVHADIAEIRQDIKLLTGKVYEMMGQK